MTVASPAIDDQGTGELPPEGAGQIEDEEPRRRRRRILLLLLLLGALIVLLGLAIWYLLFRQPINPLPPLPGETIMPGYVTSMFGAERPMGVAVTASGDRIYIGETEGSRTARLFDSMGSQLAELQPPTSTGADHVPVYLAIDPITGEVYVSDRPTGSVYVYDRAGTYQRTFKPAAVGKAAWQPLGIAFDVAGNVYVTDVSVVPQKVLEFDRSGALVRTIGADAKLSFPNGVAIDAAGYVYVTDSNNGRLLVFDTAGAIVAQLGRGVGEGNLGLPRGIAIDGQGRVYVADSSGHTVFVFGTYKPGSQRLEYLGSFGTQGIGNGQFQYPNGVALDGRGRVYVTDSSNDRVQLWSY